MGLIQWLKRIKSRRSHTRLLEERNAALQSRLEELEAQERDADPVSSVSRVAIHSFVTNWMAQDDYPNVGFIPDWAERQLLINVLYLVLLIIEQASSHVRLPVGGHVVGLHVHPSDDRAASPSNLHTHHEST